MKLEKKRARELKKQMKQLNGSDDEDSESSEDSEEEKKKKPLFQEDKRTYLIKTGHYKSIEGDGGEGEVHCYRKNHDGKYVPYRPQVGPTKKVGLPMKREEDESIVENENGEPVIYEKAHYIKVRAKRGPKALTDEQKAERDQLKKEGKYVPRYRAPTQAQYERMHKE